LLLKELEEEATYLYHPDHLGSVSVVSNQRGLPYERVEYLPFGEVWIEETDPATGYIPFRFTSKELDEETGLYYHGARYYEPTISRWMSADPAGFALSSPMGSDGKPKASYSVIESANWYAYVSNNPVIYVDPTGGEMMKSETIRQSDDRWKDFFLGGVETYDDAAKETPNSIDSYGCLFVAGVSVAKAITDRNNRPFATNVYEERAVDYANKEKYFGIPKNSRGGKDVFLSVDGGFKDMIEDFTGVEVSISRIDGNKAALEVLSKIDNDNSESYIIAEFETKSGSHFLPIQGVKRDPYGNIVAFDYTESYSGFSKGYFEFKHQLLQSIIVIKERTEEK